VLDSFYRRKNRNGCENGMRSEAGNSKKLIITITTKKIGIREKYWYNNYQ